RRDAGEAGEARPDPVGDPGELGPPPVRHQLLADEARGDLVRIARRAGRVAFRRPGGGARAERRWSESQSRDDEESRERDWRRDEGESRPGPGAHGADDRMPPALPANRVR